MKQQAGPPLRLALIGCGHWGRNIARTLARIGGTRLCRVASGNPETHQLVADDCVISHDWQDVVKADDVDAVLIATPPHTHAEIMMAAIDNAKPFFVEKPMTMDADSADAVLSHARTAGVFGMVDHIHLFSPAFRKLTAMSATLGPIRSIIALAGKNAPHVETPVLWDWGPHDIAMCLHLLRMLPDQVRASEHPAKAASSAPGVDVQLRFGGADATASMHFSNHLKARLRRFTVVHRDGELMYEDIEGPSLFFRPGDNNAVWQAVSFKDELPLDVALREFCEAVANLDTSSTSLQLGVDTVKVLDLAARSMASGDAVSTALN